MLIRAHAPQKCELRVVTILYIFVGAVHLCNTVERIFYCRLQESKDGSCVKIFISRGILSFMLDRKRQTRRQSSVRTARPRRGRELAWAGASGLAIVLSSFQALPHRVPAKGPARERARLLLEGCCNRQAPGRRRNLRSQQPAAIIHKTEDGCCGPVKAVPARRQQPRLLKLQRCSFS